MQHKNIFMFLRLSQVRIHTTWALLLMLWSNCHRGSLKNLWWMWTGLPPSETIGFFLNKQFLLVPTQGATIPGSSCWARRCSFGTSSRSLSRSCGPLRLLSYLRISFTKHVDFRRQTHWRLSLNVHLVERWSFTRKLTNVLLYIGPLPNCGPGGSTWKKQWILLAKLFPKLHHRDVLILIAGECNDVLSNASRVKFSWT